MVFLKVITKPALKDRPLSSLRASTPFGGYRKNYSRLLDMRWLQPSRIQATHIHTASYPYSYPSSQLISTRGTIVKEMRKLEEQWASDPVFPAQFPVHCKLKRSVSAPKCQFSPAGQSLIQPFLEPFEHNLGKKSSIKRLFQPTVGPISALGPNQP